MTENSKQYFEELRSSGALSRLELAVFAAFVEIGPVHNLRLLEYLQQKEAVNKRKTPPSDRIEWTRSNCWPRVTDLTNKGHLTDLGTFRVTWHSKVKTLHVRSVKYGAGDVDPAWVKVVKDNRSEIIDDRKKKATESARCKASQAGHDLQECRKRKRKVESSQMKLF